MFSPGDVLGAIQTKDERFSCCANSAADISKLHTHVHCPDSARTQGANERVVLCLMNELVADHERVL